MKRCRAGGLAIAAGMLLAGSDPAEAQQARAFVATYGNDAYGCTPGAPCRTFARAHTVVLSGGEIIALNSGGYGPVTITKPLTLAAAPGAHAGIAVFSGTGVTVDVPDSIGRVTLRGLGLVGLGGIHGIHVQKASTVRIEDCTIYGMLSSGVAFLPTTNGRVFIDRCAITNCVVSGVRMIPTASFHDACIVDTFISDCDEGIHVGPGNLDVLALGSTVTGCNFGMNVYLGNLSVDVSRCTFTNNSSAIYGNGEINGTVVRVSDSVITQNGYGVRSVQGNDVPSFGSNYLVGNTELSSESFTSVIPMQ